MNGKANGWTQRSSGLYTPDDYIQDLLAMINDKNSRIQDLEQKNKQLETKSNDIESKLEDNILQNKEKETRLLEAIENLNKYIKRLEDQISAQELPIPNLRGRGRGRALNYDFEAMIKELDKI